jgi:hypothetical protein
MLVFYAPIDTSLLVFLSWYAVFIIYLVPLTVELEIVSKFRIWHTFPFGSFIILGLLEVDIVVETCGWKSAVLPYPVLGRGSTQLYYKNGSYVSAVHSREDGGKA